MYILQNMWTLDRHKWMYCGLEKDELFLQFPGQTEKTSNSWTTDAYTPVRRHWYKATKETNNTDILFIEPYPSYSSGELSFTSTKKIIKNGQFVGVAAIDDAAWEEYGYSALYNGAKFKESGFAFATSPLGLVLTDPEIWKNPEYSYRIHDYMTGIDLE